LSNPSLTSTPSRLRDYSFPVSWLKNCGTFSGIELISQYLLWLWFRMATYYFPPVLSLTRDEKEKMLVIQVCPSSMLKSDSQSMTLLNANLAIFAHILPVKLVGRLAKYLEFKQMISAQCFCTLLVVELW